MKHETFNLIFNLLMGLIVVIGYWGAVIGEAKRHKNNGHE